MRRPAAVAAAILAAGLLVACAEEPAPTLTPPPIPEYAPPAVSEARAQEILDDVELVMLEADTAGDAELLAARVTGPAKDYRAAEYALTSVSNGEYTPRAFWTDSALTVVTATEGWPREVLAVSRPTVGETRRLILGLRQETARDPYRLVAWSSMLPSSTTPTFPSASVGTAYVTPEQAGLVATPTEALGWLAAVIANPEDEHAGSFMPDSYRDRMAEEVTGLRAGVQAAGEVSSTWQPGEIVFGVGTADGGALVMGTLTQELTIRKTIAGAKLNAGGQTAWFVGPEEVSAAVVTKYTAMVTLYIPPAGSDSTIQLIGAERIITGAERVE